MSTMQYSSEEEEEVVAVKSSSPSPSQKQNKAQSSSMLVPAAIAGVAAIAVGIGARFFLKRGKRTEEGGVGGDTKQRGKSRMVSGARKVPPRRPRSVASSVDGGSRAEKVKRYVNYVMRVGRGCVGGVTGVDWDP